jgi:peroxiredoxin
MITYAHIDLDTAEKVGATLRDKSWVYTALIEQSARAKDYARVKRLAGRAVEDGVYSLSAVEFALQQMARDKPQNAVELLAERVADFPVTRAKASEVRTLLRDLAVFPSPDFDLTRTALRKIFAAVDRPDFTESASEFEYIATYKVGGKEIKTTTTFETILLPAAAYLELFDSEAFHTRLTSLPKWGPDLANLSVFDLQGLARTNILRVQRAGPQQKSAPLPDTSKMSYQEAMAAAHALGFPANYSVLVQISGGRDLTAEQRKATFEEIFPLLRRQDPYTRYNNTRWIFWEAADSKIEGLFAEAALEWIGALDAAVDSNDRMLLQEQERGALDSEFQKLDELFQQRDFAFSQPHPSIVSRRALARLDAAANEIADFSLISADGMTFRLRDLKGKIVLIDFWATWCPPCRDAVPSLEKIHRDWNDKGVVVLGVDDESAGAIRSFNSKNGVTYPTLLDPDRKVHELFGVDGNGQGIPLSVVFDRDGKFVGRVPYPHNEESFLGVLRKAGLEAP